MTPAGEVENVNRHVLEYFGATLEELKGWAVGDAVHPDDLPVGDRRVESERSTLASHTTSSTACAALTASIAGFTCAVCLSGMRKVVSFVGTS